MKDINAFRQEFFEILRGCIRTPGDFVTIERSRMSDPSSIPDMRTYIDSSFRDVLLQNKYLYVQNHSDADQICLLDIKHDIKIYNNCVEEQTFIYNSDSDTIEIIVVKSTPKTEK